jgi:hypothetical protein
MVVKDCWVGEMNKEGSEIDFEEVAAVWVISMLESEKVQ